LPHLLCFFDESRNNSEQTMLLPLDLPLTQAMPYQYCAARRSRMFGHACFAQLSMVFSCGCWSAANVLHGTFLQT
jgi:hypothetical protein